jgi:hypothetical protein
MHRIFLPTSHHGAMIHTENLTEKLCYFERKKWQLWPYERELDRLGIHVKLNSLSTVAALWYLV